MSEHDAASRRRQLESLHNKPRIIRDIENRGEFLQLEDGFWYYAPGGKGAVSESVLRQIADELDARNKEHQEQIDAFFSNHTVPDDEIPF
jgi:hypothetical protein